MVLNKIKYIISKIRSVFEISEEERLERERERKKQEAKEALWLSCALRCAIMAQMFGINVNDCTIGCFEAHKDEIDSIEVDSNEELQVARD